MLFPYSQVYVIGGDGILEELHLAGYTGLGGSVSIFSLNCLSSHMLK